MSAANDPRSAAKAAASQGGGQRRHKGRGEEEAEDGDLQGADQPAPPRGRQRPGQRRDDPAGEHEDVADQPERHDPRPGLAEPGRGDRQRQDQERVDLHVEPRAEGRRPALLSRDEPVDAVEREEERHSGEGRPGEPADEEARLERQRHEDDGASRPDQREAVAEAEAGVRVMGRQAVDDHDGDQHEERETGRSRRAALERQDGQAPGHRGPDGGDRDERRAPRAGKDRDAGAEVGHCDPDAALAGQRRSARLGPPAVGGRGVERWATGRSRASSTGSRSFWS